jgi:predicted deacylase
VSRSRIFCEVDFDADGKQCGFLRLPLSTNESAYGWIPIPIVCLRRGDGPTALLVAGNHGDEYEGQVTLMKLCRRLDPQDIRGRIIVLPAANLPAVMAGRRVSPVDDGNLNRAFPGNPDGPPTAMIAHYIEAVLLPMVDLAIDLHSGGSSLMYLPGALVQRSDDPDWMRRSLERLEIFGAPISWVVDTPQGEERTLQGAAQRARVPYVGTELGGGGTLSPKAASIAEQGVYRLLMHYGALRRSLTEHAPRPTRLLAVGGGDYFVYAPDGGVFEPFVELGDEVKSGQLAGAVHFPDTPWREPSIARFARAGTVICKRIPGRTARGDCLFHLGTDLERT